MDGHWHRYDYLHHAYPQICVQPAHHDDCWLALIHDYGGLALNHDDGGLALNHDDGELALNHDDGELALIHDDGGLPLIHDGRCGGEGLMHVLVFYALMDYDPPTLSFSPFVFRRDGERDLVSVEGGCQDS